MKLLFAVLALGVALAAPALGVPVSTLVERADGIEGVSTTVVFRRSCGQCADNEFCDYGYPGAPEDHVACVEYASESALFRRYTPIGDTHVCSSPGTNLIANPGFELDANGATAPTNWTLGGDNSRSGVRVTTTNTGIGTRYWRAGSTVSTSNSGSISQTITTVPGVTYTFTSVQAAR
ncbi:hypothetical protein DFJ74DRAFT_751238 [Hyaloraphidium curvatum]|nr:hypothetical protein DFJ74DRAFT_751238 [Hyaloraphidium curvatum]